VAASVCRAIGCLPGCVDSVLMPCQTVGIQLWRCQPVINSTRYRPTTCNESMACRHSANVTAC